MQNEATLIIDLATGDCKMVLTKAAKTLHLTDSPSRRASHIIPRNFVLRLIFYITRFLVRDDSRLAQWTRTWGCAWLIDTRPVGGPILDGVWYNRLAAIDAEVEFLNRWFIWRDYASNKISKGPRKVLV
jgi:hypothetical protein